MIPHNTGNIIRLCANIGARLHLIKPLGFSLENKDLKRAALDYSDLSIVQMYSSLDEYVKTHDINRIFATMPSAHNLYSEIRYKIGDTLLFGPEDTGLPKEVEKLIPNPIKIPMQPNNRSLNLSNAVAVVSYEAWRQLKFIKKKNDRHPEPLQKNNLIDVS